MAVQSLDIEQLEREVDVQYFRAGGPGGQHRNKVETAVRLHHRPSGIVVTATERRSRTQNRSVAFTRLIEKLRILNRPVKPRVPTRPSRGARRRRREDKQHRAQIKKGRRSPSEHE